ncbi:hypothetical protein JW835_15640 [bacterium]|nr:hypothetical protein [bacterium]
MNRFNFIVSFLIMFSDFLFCQSISNNQDKYELIINQKTDHMVIDPVFVHNKVKDDVYGFVHAWEKALLKNGFNLITRTKINALLEERKLNMSGLTEDEKIYKIGEVVGANSVLFFDFGMEGIQNQKLLEKVQLISINGEILFTADLIFDEKVNLNSLRQQIVAEYINIIKREQ